ncbi:MAG: YcaQ family DNA glycosylase [Gemmatirosa sp.]|nr:YcaQ family DNA glycosylase [Gemmatirosa sp.]
MTALHTAAAIRRHVIANAIGAPADLATAIARMGFVQADPIRAPARAQDLVLRHRVAGYRAGDLERRYPALGIDEDFVYAFGFVSPAVRALLQPRGVTPTPARGALRGLRAEVLDHVRRAGPTHPRALVAALGARRETNAWGGQSHATTRALEWLHYMGHLRVARRERGVRVYEAAPVTTAPMDAGERHRTLVQRICELFGPMPERGLRTALRLTRHAVPDAPDRASALRRLVHDGTLVRGAVDGVPYVWPASLDVGARVAVPRVVRLLAPFDPIVWDRVRVEHLWGWAYRFEAYTPAARRQYGYYALPMLWGDRIVGWANVSAPNDSAAGALDVSLGFLAGRPREAAFARALDAELARLARFLTPRGRAATAP